MQRQPRPRLLAALLLTSALIFPARAFDLPASAVPFTVAADHLRLLGIIKGDSESGLNYRLAEPITRAELAAVVVRAFGKEGEAQAWSGEAPFVDVAPAAWHAGYISAAKRLAAANQITLGTGDGSFNPDRPVSRVEALILVLKLAGQVAPPDGREWHRPWLSLARQKGVITAAEEEELAQDPHRPASRGEAFWLLDRTFRAPLLPLGDSLYWQYVDGQPPSIDLAPVASGTTVGEVVVQGTVRDNRALDSVALNQIPVVLDGDRFAVTVDLAGGENLLRLTATDVAGNQTTKDLHLIRVASEPASLRVVSGPVTVSVLNATAAQVEVLDENGLVVSGASVQGESSLGSWEHGLFRAGTQAGKGVLRLRSGTVTAEVPVVVAAGELRGVIRRGGEVGEPLPLLAVDAWGNQVDGVTWSAPDGGLQIDAEHGVVSLVKAGSFRLVATKGDRQVQTRVAVPEQAVRASPLGVAGEQGHGDVTLFLVDRWGFPVRQGGVEIAVWGTGIRLFGPFGKPGPMALPASIILPPSASQPYAFPDSLESSPTSPVVLTSAVSGLVRLRYEGDLSVGYGLSNRLQTAVGDWKDAWLPSLDGEDPWAVWTETNSLSYEPPALAALPVKVRFQGESTVRLAGGKRTGALVVEVLDWNDQPAAVPNVDLVLQATGDLQLGSGGGLLHVRTDETGRATIPFNLPEGSSGGSVRVVNAFWLQAPVGVTPETRVTIEATP